MPYHTGSKHDNHYIFDRHSYKLDVLHITTHPLFLAHLFRVVFAFIYQVPNKDISHDERDFIMNVKENYGAACLLQFDGILKSS
jgi:hypothetical protein